MNFRNKFGLLLILVQLFAKVDGNVDLDGLLFSLSIALFLI